MLLPSQGWCEATGIAATIDLAQLNLKAAMKRTNSPGENGSNHHPKCCTRFPATGDLPSESLNGGLAGRRSTASPTSMKSSAIQLEVKL